jgi:hypothetical protein
MKSNPCVPPALQTIPSHLCADRFTCSLGADPHYGRPQQPALRCDGRGYKPAEGHATRLNPLRWRCNK